MDIKTLSTDQIAMLKAPLPAEAVSPHPTKTYLSSIKAIYVVERLNDVFGIGGWKLESKEIKQVGKMVVIQSEISIPEYGFWFQSYGGNDNEDLGDAYKGATTDALTKMASHLGIGMDVFKGMKNPPAQNRPNQVSGGQPSAQGNGGSFTPAKGYTRKPALRTLEITQDIFGEDGVIFAEKGDKMEEREGTDGGTYRRIVMPSGAFRQKPSGGTRYYTPVEWDLTAGQLK